MRSEDADNLRDAAAPAVPPRGRRRAALALLSLVIFVLAISAGAYSFFAGEEIAYCPGVRKVDEGPVRARILRYELALAHGQFGIYYTNAAWNTDDVGTTAGWWRLSMGSRSLETQPTQYDLANIRFAGFQWYHGRFTAWAVPSMIENEVRQLVLPLWPFLLAAIPPWRWWRQRRGSQARGFSVMARSAAQSDP